MKKSVEKVYKNGALSKLGKRAAVMLLCLCLMVSFVQNVAFKATYAETIEGTDVPVAQAEDIAAEEPVAAPEAPVQESAAEEPAVTPEVPEEGAGEEPAATPEEPEDNTAEEPAVSSSDDEAVLEKDEAVSESDSEETEEGISELAPVTMLAPMLMFAAAPIADEPLTAESLGLSPQITFTTSKGEGDSITIRATSTSYVYVDFGDGTLVEYTNPNVELEGTVAGSGAIKVYSADSITTFDCSSQSVTAINLSACPNLITLDCADNSLTSLDLSPCSSLKSVMCYENKLTALDLSANPNITTAWATTNNLTSINLDGCTELESLTFGLNQISELDLTHCTKLSYLYCSDNKLRFSTLKLAATPESMIFGSQDYVEIPAEVAADEVIDLSSEYICNGTVTEYVWTASGIEITPKTAEGGKFTFGEDMAGKTLTCMMTNAAFPDTWLETTTATVAANNIAEGTCGGCSWKIDSNGVLTIYPTNGVSGTLANGSSSNMTFWPWFNYANDVTSIVVEGGVCTNSSAAYLFYGMENCTSMDLSGLDTSNATSLEGLFSGCSSVTSLDVSGFNTSNVTNMRSMFYGCRKLTTVDVSGFDTSKVTNMSGMFSYCNKLTSLNVSNFKTSNVTNMSNMFNSCSALTSLDVSGFNTSNVTNMNMMFNSCSALTSLDVGDIDTSNVTNMSWMFGNCSKLKSLNVSGLDTSNVTSMSYMFQGCNKLTALDVSGFDTSKVTNMGNMFGSCSALTSVDVSNFNTSNVTNMSKMFDSCSALTSIDVSGFDTSNVTNMSEMFVGDTNLNTISVSANFTPATNYAQVASANFFNVVDGSLIYTPMYGRAIKSLTINGQPVEFDAEGGTYAGFTGDSKATITFDWARTVTFMDGETEVEKQTVAHGGNAKDPYADTANRPEKPGYEFIGWDKDITNIQSDLTVNAQWKLDLKPQIVFTTSKAVGSTLPLECSAYNSASQPEDVYIDWGDGNIVLFDPAGTTKGDTIKLYSEHDITYLSCNKCGVTSLDLSNVSPSFRNLLAENNELTSLVLDTPVLNELKLKNNQLTEIDLSGAPNISTVDLSGNKLTSLDCSKNSNLRTVNVYDMPTLKELDVSGCTNLSILYCDNTGLSELDLSKNTKLTSLKCGNTEISKLDIDGYSSLRKIYCNNTKITELDLSGCTALTVVDCSSNNISKLDLSDTASLESLYAKKCSLSELILNYDSPLEIVQAESNRLKFSTLPDTAEITSYTYNPQAMMEIQKETDMYSGVVDLSAEYDINGNTTVYTWYDAMTNSVVTPKSAEGGKFTFGEDVLNRSLYCTMTNAYYPGLTIRTTFTRITFNLEPQITFTTSKVGSELSLTAGVEDTSSPIFIDWGDGNIVTYSYYVDFETLLIYGTPVGEVKMYSADDIVYFGTEISKLTSIDVSDCPALTYLDVSYSQLTDLDVSNNSELSVLRVTGNKLTELDVSNNTKLKELYCSSNKLTELDVTNNTQLECFWCDINALTELDVTNNTLLHTFSCDDNELTELDVTNCTQLVALSCENNKITELDVTNCTLLRNFSCDDNELTELDVSNNTKLELLGCSDNELTELDVTNNTLLENLRCSGNALRFSTLKSDINSIEHSIYRYQRNIDIPEKTEINSGIIDLSAEYDIYGNKTVYTWYDAADDSVVTPKTAEGGKFTFGINEVGKSLYCTMTNAYYPDLTLETYSTKIFSRKFTLKFDVNGGDALPAGEQSKTVIYSEPVGELPTPTKAGHTFTGWIDGMSAEYTADTAYMVEGSTTLTAQWKVNKYKVNYHLNEAITEHPTKGVLPEGDEVDYNTEYTAKKITEIDGYTFFGWYTDEGYTAEFVDGTPITEDTDLYGHWSRDTITIGGAKTWVENGEGFVRPDSITVNLYQNGTLVDSCVVPKDETANVQFYSFKEMYISDEDSNLYEYTVAEETVPDKYVSVVNGFDITNSYNEDTFTILKDWDNTGNPEDIPESVDIELLCDGALHTTVTLSEENSWTARVHIPSLDTEGHEYTIREVAVPGYTTSYETLTAEDSVLFVITNTFEMPKITVGGDVVWENVPGGKTEPDMNVSLMLDGAVIDTVTVPAGTESYEFADLDRYDEEGNALAYTVEVGTLADYETEYSAPAADENGNITISITNTGIITYGTLTVSNKVTGEGADKTLKFPFKVEIDDVGSFECRIINASSFSAFSLRAAGDVINLKSGDTIELAHGDIAVISGIPAGTAYSVTETDSKGYKITSTGEKGIVGAEGAEAVFTNEFVTEVEGDSDKPTPPQTGEKDETPKTGDDYNKPLVIGLTAGFALLLAVCIISGVVAKKKRKTEKTDESETE